MAGLFSGRRGGDARAGVDGSHARSYIPRARGVHIMGATRTNIAIDDELMSKAMAATGLRTKKAVVEEALKLLVRLRAQRSILVLQPGFTGTSPALPVAA